MQVRRLDQMWLEDATSLSGEEDGDNPKVRLSDSFGRARVLRGEMGTGSPWVLDDSSQKWQGRNRFLPPEARWLQLAVHSKVAGRPGFWCDTSCYGSLKWIRWGPVASNDCDGRVPGDCEYENEESDQRRVFELQARLLVTGP
jgi:hypothetical protein